MSRQRHPHESSPEGYETLDDTAMGTADPGDDPEDVGVPPTGEDLRTSRGDAPEPMRRSVPTDTPVASLDFGTTAEEENAGETHGDRLERERPDDTPDRPATRSEQSPSSPAPPGRSGYDVP